MDRGLYQVIVRILAVFGSIGLWMISVYFSQSGFGIELPTMGWIGWIMAGCVTLLELIFQMEGMKHKTEIVILGLVAYGYGIVTNIMGVVLAQGNGSKITLENFYLLIFPILLGIILEWAPERVLVWALIEAGPIDGRATLRNAKMVMGEQRGMPQPISQPSVSRPSMQQSGIENMEGVRVLNNQRR